MEFESSKDEGKTWQKCTTGKFKASDIQRMLQGHFVKLPKIWWRLY